jgi:hypothetical protein
MLGGRYAEELVSGQSVRGGVQAGRNGGDQRRVGATVVAQQQLSQRTRRRGEHEVVDRDAKTLAGLLDVGQRQGGRAEPATGRHHVVEERRRR